MGNVIGFVGLGIMGREMVANIISRGKYETVIFNRTPAKCSSFKKKGAKLASSLAELTKKSDVIILMLADSNAVRWALEDKGGILSEMREGKTLIDMGTNSPEFNISVESMVRERMGEYLEAPVLGSKIPAREATLTVLSAGDEKVFERSRDILSCFGEKIFYMGECGKASQMKLIVNQIMAGMLALFSEGLVIGERADIPPHRMLEVIENSAIQAPIFKVKGHSMLVSHDFSPHFPLKHAQKDLRQALSCADKLDVSCSVTASVNAQFIRAKDMGFGEEDSSAVIKTLLRGDGEIHIDV
jgi:glyoxylate/succinic semialdehyde reductase